MRASRRTRGASAEAAEHRPDVRYATASEAEQAFRGELDKLLAGGAKRVCHVGGGARPAVSLKRIRELNLEYLVLDASMEELEKGPVGYERALASILDARAVAELVREHGTFDLVVSRWTAEHMADGKRFHENVRILLRPGGAALHCFPTLYALPFVVNRVLSDDLSSTLLFRTFRKRKVKFPAHYSWCRGPTHGQIAGLETCGYHVDRYYGFFGHSFYARVRPIQALHQALSRLLVRHPVPMVTSFAVVLLTIEL